MSPPRDPVPRARSPWGWLGGILVLGFLAGGLIAAAMLLWENLDVGTITQSPRPVETGPVPEPAPLDAPARARGGFPAYLYRSGATEAFFPDEAFYPSVLDRWGSLLEGVGGQIEEITSAGELVALEGVGVVAAPSAVCLDEDEVQAFHRHVEEGGGLLLTWATGARNGECDWTGWEALRELAGAAEVRQLDERPGVYLTVPAGMPLSHGIEPAARVELRWDAQIALAADGPRVYWSDWALNPAGAEGAEGVDVAVHLRQDQGSAGRVAWFGFNGDEGATPLDQRRLDTLLHNGVQWVAGLPSAELRPWPDGRRAAFAVTQHAGWEFDNARHLAELGRARGVPVTFFVTSRLALDHPGLAELLLEAGEVASQSVDEQVLAGLPYSDQRALLSRSLTQIRGWAGGAAVGLRPPEEQFDQATLRAWRSLGGRYVVGINNARTGSPEIHATEEGPIALVPRLIKDDYNVMIQDRAMRIDDLVAEYLGGMRKLHALGGLALVTTHSQLAGTSRRVAALGQVMDSVRVQDGWWPVTLRELGDWALARSGAVVEMGGWQNGRLELEVAAPDDAALVGAWLEVSLPDDPASWEPRVEGRPVEFAVTPWGIAVPLDPLEAGERWRLVVERFADDEEESEAERVPSLPPR